MGISREMMQILPYDNFKECLNVFSCKGEEDASWGDGDKEEGDGEERQEAGGGRGGGGEESPPGHGSQHTHGHHVHTEDAIHGHAPPT